MSDPLPFINRELSWLEFNHRVLEEAQDAAVPILERLKFLAITASNLDEFFMVRVGGLQELQRAGGQKKDASGLTVDQQLTEISKRTHQFIADQYACLRDLEQGLVAAGIRCLLFEQLTPDQHEYVRKVFEQEIFPVVTPLAVPPDKEFPLLSGLGVVLCLRLADVKEPAQVQFTIVALPKKAARFIALPRAEGYQFIMLEDIIRGFAERLFPGRSILECVVFRLTRDADMAMREDLAGDLLSQMQEVLDARKQSACVRLEVTQGASKPMLSFFRNALDVDDPAIYEIPGPIDLSSFFRLSMSLAFESLKYKPWPPQMRPEFAPGASMFAILSRQDVLLFHPYDSFEPVLRLIDQAADDPDVLAIKQILYRTSDKSPVVAALARAAARGKHVTAIVELKARFDEARNIEWARALERAGVNVIYGIKGFKTHAKLCMVVRREAVGIRRYMHFGTGNYNEVTARIYSDISFMTSNEDLGSDAAVFFNTITGYSSPSGYRSIEAAPIGLRTRLLNLIDSEAQRCKQGQEARIKLKINSLVDEAVIKALYAASQAGVQIQINVRGICRLKPGVPGISENISVISIVDRFLEHSRIMYFYHGGDPLLFISSADWMSRNFDRRIELLVPIENPQCRERLISFLDTFFQDNVKARRLLPDNTYERVRPRGKKLAIRSQETLYRAACEASAQRDPASRTIFQPLLPASAEE